MGSQWTAKDRQSVLAKQKSAIRGPQKSLDIFNVDLGTKRLRVPALEHRREPVALFSPGNDVKLIRWFRGMMLNSSDVVQGMMVKRQLC